MSSPRQTANLLNQSALEIEQLRRANQSMGEQLSIVHIFAAALGLRPQSQGAMAPDVAAQCRAVAAALEQEAVEAAKPRAAEAADRGELHAVSEGKKKLYAKDESVFKE